MSGLRHKAQNRVFARFIPEGSISAAILDEDFHVVQGVVSNISETGAALVTNRSVLGGPDVNLRLSRKYKGIIELEAKIVWMAEGMSTSGELVGSLLGLSFPDQSIGHRERIRDFCWHSEVFSSDQSSRHEPLSQKHFDMLVDPDIERLCSEDDTETACGKTGLTVPDADFAAAEVVLGPGFATHYVGRALFRKNGSGSDFTARESSPFLPESSEEATLRRARGGVPSRRVRKIRDL